MPDAKCDQCGTFGPIALTTATGRRLCDDCADAFQGAAASMVMGGSSPDVTARAVAASGWLSRIRAAMRKRRTSD